MPEVCGKAGFVVMDAGAWQAVFEQRAVDWRAEREAFWARLAAAGVSPVRAAVRPVVLEAGAEVDADHADVPASARKVVAVAQACGWAARLVRSVAADPGKGIVLVVTARLRRHDERLWAAWFGGGFDVAWYSGPTGLERAGWSRLATLSKSAATRAAKAGTEVAAPTTRGVLDIIEGIRGPKQWVDVLARAEMDQAVGLISAAFPGLSLTRQ